MLEEKLQSKEEEGDFQANEIEVLTSQNEQLQQQLKA